MLRRKETGKVRGETGTVFQDEDSNGSVLFRTCQVRVVRFYVNWPASSSSSSSSFLRQTSTASSRSQLSPPDPNSNLWIKVIPAGPQLQALERSVPRRTSTACARSQCSPPDPNSKLWIKVFPAGPQPRAPDQSVPRRFPRRTSTANSGSKCCCRNLTTKNLRRYTR